jgi:hypothetical protein
MPMTNNSNNNNGRDASNNNNNRTDASYTQERFVFCEECDIRIPDRDIPSYWTPIFCLYCPECCRLRV